MIMRMRVGLIICQSGGSKWKWSPCLKGRFQLNGHEVGDYPICSCLTRTGIGEFFEFEYEI
jgi:hypothetical protein